MTDGEKDVARANNKTNDGASRVESPWHRTCLLDTTDLVHHWNTAVHLGIQRCGITGNERCAMAYSRADHRNHWPDNILGCKERQEDVSERSTAAFVADSTLKTLFSYFSESNLSAFGRRNNQVV